MMRQTSTVLGSAIVCSLCLACSGSQNVQKAAGHAESSSAIVTDALQTAQRTHRQVFVTFGAHWCTACSNFKATFVDNRSLRTVLDKYFVFVSLDVNEHRDMAQFENEGARAVLDQWGGTNKGLPFWAIVDQHQRLRASSVQAAGRNEPSPVGPVSVGKFLTALHAANSQITTTDLWRIRSIFLP